MRLHPQMRFTEFKPKYSINYEKGKGKEKEKMSLTEIQAPPF